MDVGHGHDLAFLGQVQELLGAAAYADIADADAIAGARLAGRRQNAAGDQGRKGEARGGQGA